MRLFFAQLVAVILLCCCSFTVELCANEPAFIVDSGSAKSSPSGAVKLEKKWSQYYPYTPEVKEYTMELGAMWEKRNLYWVGGSFGHHLGKCVFSDSQTCQQYFDVIGGAGGREGQTHGIVLGALRWQFVSFPAPLSPSFRLLAGVMNIRDEVRDLNAFSYGVSYGLTASVQKGFDLRIEYRVGGGDRLWSQTLLSMSLKIDRWVDYFGSKLKTIGVGTVNVTGKVLDKTISAPGKMIDWIKQPENKPGQQKKINNK